MKKTAIILFFLITALSCSDNQQKLLPSSSGNINNISVVTNDELWEGAVGEVIRENFGRPIYGLPQIEPIFSLSHIPSKVFSGFATKSRTILKIDVSENEGVFNFKNTYASPQRIIQIKANSPDKIIEIINENLNSIYSTMYFNEIQEKQRRISKNLNKSEAIKNNTGVSLKFPSAYRVAKADTNFVWIRRDTETGSVNLFIHRQTNLTEQSIIEKRDSISKIYIPGPVENTYMSTDLIYTPNTQEINMGGKQVFETRGLWEIEGQFMAGPFLNFQIKLGDDDFIMLDGFVYSPGSTKREYIFELEAIMRSLKD
jgi:hypothetical protein|tara:strand:+ start:11778 stop:12719 length:942 start_codon:yes stop_codon:yes gene_type:complete